LGKLRFSAALVGVAFLSALVTIAALAGGATSAPVKAAVKTTAPKAKPSERHAPTKLASVRVRLHPKAKPKKKAPVLVGARHIGASPSLYERTTSIKVLRAQGCVAGRKQTAGLVVLDFGKLDYERSRGGYGTITFADRFATNRAITWAVKSYARGYSQCLPKSSKAKITLARGTSNYGQASVPSTYTAGRLWAGATVAFANYLKRHHFDHVTAAAADDVEPAWDREFHLTYNFFRGYGKSDHGYLLYNYGSLDGGVGGIWKLRQAFYVSGGMRSARAVPEIYNHEMARQWAELARLSYARYGKPIQLAGVMTQHWTSCGGCGYTAPKARNELVTELTKANVMKRTLPSRTLAAVTNIGAAPYVSVH
jgi:hypothetical protein